MFQPPWTDNNPLARITHISAQWSYFPRFEAKSEISLSEEEEEEEEERVSNRWPWTRWSKVQVDRPWRGSRRPRFGEKEGRRKGPAGVHTPAQRRKRFLAAFDESETAFERTNAPRRCVYMGAIEPVTFIREPVFVHGLSSRATDLIYPRHASLLSRRHLHMRIAARIGHFARFLDPIPIRLPILSPSNDWSSWFADFLFLSGSSFLRIDKLVLLLLLL